MDRRVSSHKEHGLYTCGIVQHVHRSTVRAHEIVFSQLYGQRGSKDTAPLGRAEQRTVRETVKHETCLQGCGDAMQTLTTLGWTTRVRTQAR